MKNFEEINRALVAKKKYLLLNRALVAKKKHFSLLSLSVAVFCLVAGGGLTSCKAWRTISTTSTYVQQDDSTKTTTTISTKTVEEYQGHKK